MLNMAGNTKKYIILFGLILIPVLLGFATLSTFGPWIGLREQANSPNLSTNGIKIYANSSNDLCSLHEDNSTYKLNLADPNENITISGVLRTDPSNWYCCKYIDVISVSPGGSGSTLTIPDTNTLGGYQLDASNEYLYSDGRACSNWDTNSNLDVIITFEVNVDNSGGNITDTVDLSLLAYYKGNGDTANKTQTVEIATIVGQSARYKQFISTHSIDYDLVSNVVDSNDLISFRINLETDTSEVDNIIVNFIIFRYKTGKVNIEI